MFAPSRAARRLSVIVILVLAFFVLRCGDKAAVVQALYGTESAGDESILFDREAELDGQPGTERIVLVASRGSERLGFLKREKQGEKEVWTKAVSLDFTLQSEGPAGPGAIEGARIVRKITTFPTGPGDPDSVLVEYFSEDPEVGGVTRQIFVFTRLARTFDSLVIAGFNKYENQIKAAGGLPYKVGAEGLVLFPDAENKTDILPLQFNGRSFVWLHDDGPFFYIYPLEARREDKRLKGTFKIVNRGETVKNVRVFIEMPSVYGGPGGLRDLVVFEPGRWKKDEEESFEFDTRFPKDPPVLLLRIVAGKKDDYEFPAYGESSDRVVKVKGDRYYAVPVKGL